MSDVLNRWHEYVQWASRFEGEVNYEGKSDSPKDKDKTSRIFSKVFIDSEHNRMLIIAEPEEGPRWIDGVNEDYKFSLIKRNPDAKAWTANNLGWAPTHRDLIGALYTTCQGFVVINRLLPDILSLNTVTISPIEQRDREGHSTLQLHVTEHPTKSVISIKSAVLTLDAVPPYLPLGFSGDLVDVNGPVHLDITNVYDYEKLRLPSIKQQVLHIKHLQKDGTAYEGSESRRISLAQLTLTSSNDYKLQKFGIDEPPIHAGSHTRLVLTVNLVLIVLITLFIVWRRRQQATSK